MVDLAGGPHASAMALDNPAHIREPDASAWELIGAMEPLEYAAAPDSMLESLAGG